MRGQNEAPCSPEQGQTLPRPPYRHERAEGLLEGACEVSKRATGMTGIVPERSQQNNGRRICHREHDPSGPAKMPNDKKDTHQD